MPYIKLPITGIGTDNDPFRPLLPVPIASLVGLRWSAHIPSNPDGTPRFVDCYVWIPNSFTIPGGVIVATLATARADIINRDPQANPNAMEI